MDTESTMQDKQVTVDVPAERVPEFYAMYAHFLAGRRGRRRGRGRGGHGHPGRCGAHRPEGHGTHGERHEPVAEA